MPSKITITSNRFPAIAAALPVQVGRIVRQSAQAILQDVQVGMAGPHTGRVYTTPEGKEHQASAPGEMPAIDIGHLAGSIQVEMEGATRAIVWTDAEYAEALEYGSPARRLLPRPFFTPAAERERPHFLGAMADLEKHL